MGRSPRTTRTSLFVVLIITMLSLAACGPSVSVSFEPDGGSYDEQSVDSVLAGTDISHLEDVDANEAPETRREALVDLRTQGDDASSVADLLMDGFPVQTRAVPVLVEGATFDGEDAWVIVEAWGEEGGVLEHRRVWVFARDSGDLLFSASRR
jgi:hypothetical protein